MKKQIAIILMLSAGCSSQRPTISQVQPRMGISEVREIAPLTLLSMEPAEHGYIAQYRGVFEKPYLLTFEISPPLTKEQLTRWAEKNNVVEPGELDKLYSFEGGRVTFLLKIELDERPPTYVVSERRPSRYKGPNPFERQQTEEQQRQMRWDINRIEQRLDWERMRQPYFNDFGKFGYQYRDSQGNTHGYVPGVGRY